MQRRVYFHLSTTGRQQVLQETSTYIKLSYKALRIADLYNTT